MRFFAWSISSWAASAAFWLAFGACVAPEPPHGAPQARVIVEWDPTACGEPHRVAAELLAEGDVGAPLSVSAPCELGGATFEAIAYGSYRGRVYAWQLGEAIRSVAPLEIEADSKVVRIEVATPR